MMQLLQEKFTGGEVSPVALKEEIEGNKRKTIKCSVAVRSREYRAVSKESVEATRGKGIC